LKSTPLSIGELFNHNGMLDAFYEYRKQITQTGGYVGVKLLGKG
jgi:hypothetical protein